MEHVLEKAKKSSNYVLLNTTSIFQNPNLEEKNENLQVLMSDSSAQRNHIDSVITNLKN